MPKRGRRHQAEQEREGERTFRGLRHRHHAVESDIHCLEHHGLNRCPDKGLPGYKPLCGFGSAGLQPAQDRAPMAGTLARGPSSQSLVRLKGAFRNKRETNPGKTPSKIVRGRPAEVTAKQMDLWKSLEHQRSALSIGLSFRNSEFPLRH